MIFCFYLDKREQLTKLENLDSRVFALCIIFNVDPFFAKNLFCIEHAEVAYIGLPPCIGFFFLFIFLIVGIKLNLIYICLSAHTHAYAHVHTCGQSHACVCDKCQANIYIIHIIIVWLQIRRPYFQLANKMYFRVAISFPFANEFI